MALRGARSLFSIFANPSIAVVSCIVASYAFVALRASRVAIADRHCGPLLRLRLRMIGRIAPCYAAAVHVFVRRCASLVAVALCSLCAVALRSVSRFGIAALHRGLPSRLAIAALRPSRNIVAACLWKLWRSHLSIPRLCVPHLWCSHLTFRCLLLVALAQSPEHPASCVPHPWRSHLCFRSLQTITCGCTTEALRRRMALLASHAVLARCDQVTSFVNCR